MATLDRFLRDTWLERCGHLSVFSIGGFNYHMVAEMDAYRDMRRKKMQVKFGRSTQSRTKKTHVAIIPTGFTCTREHDKPWHATVRFGSALFLSNFASTEQLLQAVEERVHALSSTAPLSLSSHTLIDQF